MASTYATALQFKTKFERFGEYDDAVIDEYLEEGETVDIIPVAGDFLATIAANANGLIALKHITMGLAYEYLVRRQKVSIKHDSPKQREAVTFGDRARKSLNSWIKWASGQSGSLHTEKLTDAPTFDMKEPETWDIDPEGTDE